MNNVVIHPPSIYSHSLATSGVSRRSSFVAHSHALRNTAKASRVYTSACVHADAARPDNPLHASQRPQAVKHTFYLSNQPLAQGNNAQPATEFIVSNIHLPTGQVNLQADNDITLQAAKNVETQTTNSKSSSSSVGVGYTMGKGGAAFGVTVSASGSKGKSDGTDTAYTNTTIDGKQVNITSGGNTTLKGAVVTADKVKAKVGGDLLIESLQNSATYTSKDQSIGGSATFGTGASVSANAGMSKINSNFQSVGTQSGIRAGDGGFEVDVKGNTTLKGGVISSSQAAVDKGLNSFNGNTAEGLARLTMTDIDNKAEFKAQSVSISTSGGGAGSMSDKSASTSKSGITGIAGNKDTRTGEKETGLVQIFDKDKVKADIQAQVAITTAFGQNASKAIGDYGASKLKEAADKQARAKELPAGSPERAALEAEASGIQDAWKEGGSLRVAAHAIVGGLSGGVQGALGQGTTAAAAPVIEQLTEASNLPPELKKALGGALALTIGVATGGTNGAVAGLNGELNNRQLHPDERKWAKDNASKYRDYLNSKTGENISTEEAYQRLLSAGYAVVDTAAANAGKSDEAAKQFINEASPKTLFVATAAERANPLLGGNKDGSFSPEQQARFGQVAPANRASALISKAEEYLGKDCGGNSVQCQKKFETIDNAIGALNSAKVLYQDDPGSLKLIDQQIELLKQGITKSELASGAAGSISDTYKNIAAVVTGVPSKVVAGPATAEFLSSYKVGLNTITVYRVEGIPNTRISIDEVGTVAIQGEQTLFLNFGSKERAVEFLNKRIDQGMASPEIKSFEVTKKFFDDIKSTAVPESLARQNPGSPILVDPTKAANQFGIRVDQFDSLRNSIIPGSGRSGR
jgi:filamentous hemagglutinin